MLYAANGAAVCAKLHKLYSRGKPAEQAPAEERSRGVMESLTRAEFRDLIRYLSELGKTGQ